MTERISIVALREWALILEHSAYGIDRAQAPVVLALVEAAEAAHAAVVDDTRHLSGGVQHSESCAIWVELDDVSAVLHPSGTCDCGLATLQDALGRFDFGGMT